MWIIVTGAKYIDVPAYAKCVIFQFALNKVKIFSNMDWLSLKAGVNLKNAAKEKTKCYFYRNLNVKVFKFYFENFRYCNAPFFENPAPLTIGGYSGIHLFCQ